MSIPAIISAIGNNSSVYPLLVRDCGIENPTKVVLTYNQNKDESKKVAYLAVRERLIDEYATSAVWLGGIPLVGWLVNKFIKFKGLNPDVNLKLFKEEAGIQGIDYNIKKFRKLAPDAVNDLIKVKQNKKLYERLLAGKFVLSTGIPILFMGFILPKMIFASSEKRIANLKAKQANNINNRDSKISFLQKDKFYKNQVKDVAFKGNWISTVANFSAQSKMAVTDGGYAAGRISTARNKNESYDWTFKMAGMMLFNYVTPKWIEKGLDKLTGKTLDPIMLADEVLIDQLKNGSIKLPKTDNAKDLLEFIDDTSNNNSMFIKYAKRFNKLKMIKSSFKDLYVRDPRAYIDIKDLGDFRNSIEDFAKQISKSKDVSAFIKRAKISKYTNILTNVVTSSILLAYVLPKLQFAFRKIITGSDLEPGLADNADDKTKNKTVKA